MEESNFEDFYRFFIDEFDNDLLFHVREPADKQEEILVEIFDRVNDIHTVFERLERYEIYFEYFFPSTEENIDKAEVIEYHLHSYLQEFYSLHEKLKRVIGLIKNSIKHFDDVGNPEELKTLVAHLQEQVENGMGEVTILRGGHVHDMSVRDFDLSKAKTLKTLGNLEGVNKEYVTKQYEQLVTEAKKKYIGQAGENKIQLQGIKNFLAPRFGKVIAFLYNKDEDRFDNAVKVEEVSGN